MAVLASSFLVGSAAASSSPLRHTQRDGETLVPSRTARGRGDQGRRGEGGRRQACLSRTVARAHRRLSRRLTSPRPPTSKSPIMATPPRPASPRVSRRATRPGRDVVRRFLAASDVKPRDNFTVTSPARRDTCSRFHRKYDDCHGVPRPPRRNLRARGASPGRAHR